VFHGTSVKSAITICVPCPLAAAVLMRPCNVAPPATDQIAHAANGSKHCCCDHGSSFQTMAGVVPNRDGWIIRSRSAAGADRKKQVKHWFGTIIATVAG
jgi:hypothetical protein